MCCSHEAPYEIRFFDEEGREVRSQTYNESIVTMEVIGVRFIDGWSDERIEFVVRVPQEPDGS